MNVIETKRLILRTWNETDAEAYFQINQDSKVIEFLPGPLSYEQVKAFMNNCNRCFAQSGFCLFAVELKATGEMIGFIGLSMPSFDAHFTPAVEVGWRLGSQYWGRGYATEGAKAVLEYGFEKCDLQEIVSFTVPANIKSIQVMERIGMHRNLTDGFSHPKYPVDHPLSKHVLYRIRKEAYSLSRAKAI